MWLLTKSHTLDHLVQLDTYIRKAFALIKSCFNSLSGKSLWDNLDPWYTVLKNRFHFGLRGYLPVFIREFLSARTFRIRLWFHLSDTFTRNQGIPQGSILSVALFLSKLIVFLLVWSWTQRAFCLLMTSWSAIVSNIWSLSRDICWKYGQIPVVLSFHPLKQFVWFLSIMSSSTWSLTLFEKTSR